MQSPPKPLDEIQPNLVCELLTLMGRAMSNFFCPRPSKGVKRSTRMSSRWGAITNPHAKVFDPQHPQVPPRGHDPSNRIKIPFNIIFFICENTHKVWYKNLWNWHDNWNLMLFDLLTSPQGHQFDPRMKILLAFCSARHPCRFDMPHDHVWIKNFFDPLGTPNPPKSYPWGMIKATE